VATEERPGIVDVVLDIGSAGRPRRFLVAAVIAIAAHASVWGGTRSSPALRAELATKVSRPPVRDLSIDLTAPPPPQPPRNLPPPAPPAQRQPARARVAPPPPAQAGSVIVQERDPTAPLDLTAEPFVTGTANAHAGGATTATGTNTLAVATREVDPRSPPSTAAVPDRSSAVALEAQSWSCPWPQEADAEQIDEQSVIIRVVVTPDGAADSVEVVSDPGHGFGRAATTCALQTRFTPARDGAGTPIRARSPPIRVRFTR
jgi:periplasmic protein TonB